MESAFYSILEDCVVFTFESIFCLCQPQELHCLSILEVSKACNFPFGGSPICHDSVFFRKKLMLANGTLLLLDARKLTSK